MVSPSRAATFVQVNFGDGTTDTLNNGAGLPMTVAHAWATPRAKTVTATGLGAACDYQATTAVSVLTPPTVSVTAPAQGAQFPDWGTIPITATASAAQGTIAQVDFFFFSFNGGNYLYTDTTAPYAYNWPGVAPGTYAITARATDTAGAVATSSAITVVVGTPPPSTVLGVSVTPAVAGQPATVTVTGTNPCGMLWMDFGDGDWWIAPINDLPHVTTKTWTTPGTYTVLAKGFMVCGGEVTTQVTVAPAGPVPAPEAEPEPEPPLDLEPSPLVVSATAAAEPEVSERDADTLAESRASALTARPAANPASAAEVVTLYVDINGTGAGTVAGSVSCTGSSTTCAATFNPGQGLYLMATAAPGSVFTGWTGVCANPGWDCGFGAVEGLVIVANFRSTFTPVTTYYHVDVLGSVRAMSNAAGAVLERHDYRPFGEDNMPLPAPGADPARFLGQPRDQTKLDYFGARMYSMFTGRFTGVDPGNADADLFVPQSWNAYAYARNNPLRFIDTTGFSAEQPVYRAIGWGRMPVDPYIPCYATCSAADGFLGDEEQGPRLPGRDSRGRGPGPNRGQAPQPPGLPLPAPPPPASSVPVASPQPDRTPCSSASADRGLGYSALDFVVGMGDAFLVPIVARNYLDWNAGIDFGSSAYSAGGWVGAAVGSIPLALSGGAALGATKTPLGTLMNGNRYFRIGPGRWGGESGVPRVSSPYLKRLTEFFVQGSKGHIKLTSQLGPGVPPLGSLGSPSCSR